MENDNNKETTNHIESIIANIQEKIDEFYISQYTQYQSQSNRASQLGHPCERYLVLERISPDKKQLPDKYMIRLFALGEIYERIVRNELETMGYRIIEQQTSYLDEKNNISGTIDFKLLINGQVFPCEVKGLSPANFEKINSVDDIINSDAVYIQMYYTQMLIYLYLTKYDTGLLILKNKSTNETKFIVVKQNIEYLKQILKKARKINQYVKNNTIPPVINNTAICSECPYFLYCAPDIKAQHQLYIKDEMIDDIEKREQLRVQFEEIKKQYEEIDKKIKESIKATHKPDDIIVVGDRYMIVVKEVVRKAYSVPETKYIQINIKNLIKEETNE